jgi:hypothetical protein
MREKFDAVVSQVSGHDEKIQNVGKLVKLQNSFTEAQEEDIQTLK